MIATRALTSEELCLVLNSLIGLLDDFSTSQANLIDPFDIRRASPARHQSCGLRSSVLVREDHRVAHSQDAASFRQNFVVHQKGNVCEPVNCICASVKKGCVGQSQLFHISVLCIAWRGK